MQAELSSGDLARATGNTVRTIRFYEEQGLLRSAVVREGGHRRYTADDLDRLRLILDLREIGLSLCEIRALLDLRAGCHTAGEFALRFGEALQGHIAQARTRIERLRRVRRELSEALATIKAQPSELTSDCPCAVAASGGAPRIVKLMARDESCQHGGQRSDAPAGTQRPSGSELT
jgi:DNA-binding transcriptional MerR regulator